MHFRRQEPAVLMSMLTCCGASKHAWDRYKVESRWVPKRIYCLIIGENPGDTTSEYFYARPASYENDSVVVRRSLLRGLHQHGLIKETTLEGFRDAGFLFDHAIRCQLPPKIIAEERQKAIGYRSRLVENPFHLHPYIANAKLVWVMGHIASNAASNATLEFPKDRRKLSLPPFPAPIGPNTRFFLSEYITWRNEGRAIPLCGAFARFALS